MKQCVQNFPVKNSFQKKMIRQEIKVEMMQNNIKKTQETIANILEEEIKKTRAKVSQKLESIQSNVMEVVEREKEKNEEILKKAFEELRNDFTNDMEEGRKMLIELSENIKKPSVAFFAHNVVELKLNKTDEIIIFTTATTNEGSGYDTSSGIFTAPVGGLYQFVVNYCTRVKQHSPLALVLSGNVIARSNNYDAKNSACSSFSAVMRVKYAEQLWVKCLYGYSGYALNKDGWRMNSFSGILINK